MQTGNFTLKNIYYALTYNPFDLETNCNQADINSIATRFTDIILEAAKLPINLKIYQNIKKIHPMVE